jgi:hypothetical protein
MTQKNLLHYHTSYFGQQWPIGGAVRRGHPFLRLI